MQAELIVRRPRLATGILVVGAVGYWFLCQPAIWTRGWPPLDPFWYATPWLCVFPVFISAVFDDDRRRRVPRLLLYGLVTGFVAAGVFGGGLIPRRMSFEKMLAGTIVSGPVFCAITMLLEYVGQRVLRKLRRFTDDDRCHRCGYLIRYLTVARCPECGTPFDEKWLNAGDAPVEPTPHPRRTRFVVVMLVGAMIAFPPVYRWPAIEYAWRRAWADAKRDWRTGKAVVYVDGDRLWYDTFERLFIINQRDPLSGLTIRPSWILSSVERRAYNRAIEEELTKQGKLSINRYILTERELEKFLNEASFEMIDEIPCVIHGDMLVTEDIHRADRLSVNGESTGLPAQTRPCRYAVVLEPPGLLVLQSGDRICTWLPGGTLLQHAVIQETRRGWKVLQLGG